MKPRTSKATCYSREGRDAIRTSMIGTLIHSSARLHGTLNEVERKLRYVLVPFVKRL